SAHVRRSNGAVRGVNTRGPLCTPMTTTLPLVCVYAFMGTLSSVGVTEGPLWNYCRGIIEG
ncbi:MAG: hypothetical protein ACO22U_18970, partial [bacterium]